MNIFSKNNLLIGLLTLVLQVVNAQSYSLKLNDDSLVSLEYFEDSVRILSSENKILYIDEDGFVRGVASICSKSTQGSFDFALDNGVLKVEPKVNYVLRLKNKSVRYVSEHFIGTYDGIFRDYQKFSKISYCQGAIREQGDSTIISWDGLTILTPEKIYDFTSYDTINTMINGQRIGFTRDAVPFGKQLALLTTTGVYFLDVQTNEVSQVFDATTDRIQLFSTETSVNGELQALTLGIADQIIRVFKNGTCSVIETLSEEFVYFNKNQEILTSPNNIHDYERNYQFKPSFPYHVVFRIKDVYFASSDFGLFANVDSEQPIQLNDIEFNKRSYFYVKDTVSLGSVQGLYKYPAGYLTKLLPESEKRNNAEVQEHYLIGLIFLGFVLIVGIILILVSVNKKLKRLSSRKKEVSFELLNEYITLNLSVVSIASICEEFGLTQKELYAYFPGSSPGAAIKHQRLEKAQSMYDEGNSTDLIAKATGYSKKYLSQSIIPILRKAQYKQKG